MRKIDPLLRAKHHGDNVLKILRNQRTTILEILGGKCQRCGFSDPRALQIDHVHGGGAALRKKNKSQHKARGTTFLVYQLWKAGKSLEDYQLLCANCNWIKRVENGEVRHA